MRTHSPVRDGLGDEAGATLIEQRGIDFAPAEDFLQSLKAAGRSPRNTFQLSAHILSPSPHEVERSNAKFNRGKD
jgi:hypothetical protein